MARLCALRRGRGNSAKTKVTALRDNVNFNSIDGTMLVKKGDVREYDCDIYVALGSSRAVKHLKGLVCRGLVKVDISYKEGSAQDRHKKGVELRKLEAEREEKKRIQEQARLANLAKLAEKSSKSEELTAGTTPEQGTFTCDDSSSYSSEEFQEEEISSSGTVEEEIEVDLDALSEYLESELRAVHGISGKTAKDILKLDSWDRSSVDAVRFMQSANVPRVLGILEPHKDTFGK